jgi:hypothetical protein
LQRTKTLLKSPSSATPFRCRSITFIETQKSSKSGFN